jgi:hypothetical protein
MAQKFVDPRTTALRKIIKQLENNRLIDAKTAYGICLGAAANILAKHVPQGYWRDTACAAPQLILATAEHVAKINPELMQVKELAATPIPDISH